MLKIFARGRPRTQTFNLYALWTTRFGQTHGVPCPQVRSGGRLAGPRCRSKGLWRGAGERFFLGSGQSQVFIALFPSLPRASTQRFFGLLRPSTRIARDHTPPHGQTPPWFRVRSIDGSTKL
eukprot:scaffold23837_cov47-Phaeocystis_antarctica.AAC.2